MQQSNRQFWLRAGSSCLATSSTIRIGGFGSLSSSKRLLVSWLFVTLILMCFGVGASSSSSDYYRQPQYIGSGERMSDGRSSSNSWAMMPLENVMSEPQALRADRMMLRLVMDATTPTASLHRNSWKSALNVQQRNMAWERLGWGW